MAGKLDQISLAIGELRAGQDHLREQAAETAQMVRDVAAELTKLNGVDVKLAAMGLDHTQAESHRADFRLLRISRAGLDWMTRRAWQMIGASILIWVASTHASDVWQHLQMGGS